jgi:hypothetical protein
MQTGNLHISPTSGCKEPSSAAASRGNALKWLSAKTVSGFEAVRPMQRRARL